MLHNNLCNADSHWKRNLNNTSQTDGDLDRHVQARCQQSATILQKWVICQPHHVIIFILAGLCFRDLSQTIVRNYIRMVIQSTNQGNVLSKVHSKGNYRGYSRW